VGDLKAMTQYCFTIGIRGSARLVLGNNLKGEPGRKKGKPNCRQAAILAHL